MTNRSLPNTTITLLIATMALVLGSVGGAVAGGLVTSKDIKNGAVQSKDIRANTIKSHDLAPQTAARVSGYQVSDVSQEANPDETNLALSDSCSSGKYLLGASAYWIETDHAPQVFISGDGRSATAYSDNTISNTDYLHLRLICANVSKQSASRQSVRPGK